MPLDRLIPGPLDAYVRSDGARPDDLWLFLHIPKTAGTSLGGQLMRGRPPARNLFVDYSAKPEARRSAGAMLGDLVADGSIARYRFITGHFRMPQLAATMAARPDLRVFTMLREPVARVVSDYRYSTSTVHPLWEEARRRFPDLAAFAAVNRNWMTQFLSPRPGMPPDELIGWLESRLTFVGIVDMYEKSLAVLGRLMNIRLDPGIRQNATEAGGAKMAEPSDDLRQEIAALNAFDVALYRHFRRRLAAVTLARAAAPAAVAAGLSASSGSKTERLP